MKGRWKGWHSDISSSFVHSRVNKVSVYQKNFPSHVCTQIRNQLSDLVRSLHCDETWSTRNYFVHKHLAAIIFQSIIDLSSSLLLRKIAKLADEKCASSIAAVARVIETSLGSRTCCNRQTWLKFALKKAERAISKQGKSVFVEFVCTRNRSQKCRRSKPSEQAANEARDEKPAPWWQKH